MDENGTSKSDEQAGPDTPAGSPAAATDSGAMPVNQALAIARRIDAQANRH